MKHIFLTGEIQIGKSTVIRKTLSQLDVRYGGFRTYFGPDRARADRSLFIGGASAGPVFDESHAVVHFLHGVPADIRADRFDTLGAELVRNARRSSRLILMDECGDLEREAAVFQREILSALDESVPVLGVIKQASQGWVNGIRNHPNVEMISVDLSNRDLLPELLARRLSDRLEGLLENQLGNQLENQLEERSYA